MNEIQGAVSPNGLDVYRSPSKAKGMPIGLSSVSHDPAAAESSREVLSGLRPQSRKQRAIENRLLVVYRPSRRRWYGFIHLLHLRVGLQPKPQLPSVERTPPRGLFPVATPCPGCNVSHSVHFGQADDLPASFCFSQHDCRLTEGSGPGACPIGRVMSMELAIDLRSPGLLVQDSLDSGATGFDVVAWLELVIATKRMLDQRQLTRRI